jgi:serine-type D-Ala-D-Ala carboxypeptidase (penicillin-binding protein 5/6)
MREGRCVSGRRDNKRREMASLTKMMTLITMLELAARAGIDAGGVRVKASKNSCLMVGTTAELKQGAVYLLQDLYFGMMLPSGNDAAYLIAEVGGAILRLMRAKGKL